ncbi:hypothetical protein NL522_26835, partial [Klebsiella pneumoniae]|nr:hypothetical protein [Klebsiella pneumoniae]
VLNADTTFHTVTDFVNVIFEAAQGLQLAFVDNHVNEVRNGMECGIGVKNYNDVRTGDVIEVFEIIEIQRTIA